MLISHRSRMRVTERLRRFIGGMPRRVQVAALPWRRTEEGLEVLLVTSRGGGRWVLPKGWPQTRELAHEAAAREAAEEAGVTGFTARRAIGCFYYAKALPTGMRWRCEVLVFPMKVDRIADEWPEHQQRTRRWFAPRDAARLVDERDLGELIAGFGLNPRKFVV